jgi:hypothetical protein
MMHVVVSTFLKPEAVLWLDIPFQRGESADANDSTRGPRSLSVL